MWKKEKKQFVGPEVRGKSLGVIGLGAIGAIVANAAAQGLGMNVVGFDPFISVESAWSLSRSIKRYGNMDEAYAQSDYITLHIPLTDIYPAYDQRRRHRQDEGRRGIS